MAVTGSKIINLAEKYLGKGGSFVWKYYGLARGTAWCAAFVSYVMAKTGAKNLFYGGKPVFYVPYAQQWLNKNCKHVKMADAKAGDIVIFTWDGNGYNSEHGSRDHIGFIRKKGTSGVAYTIEGNTSGGKVAYRRRSIRHIYGIYRLKYAAEIKSTKPIITYIKGKTYTLQADMNVRKGAGVRHARKKRIELTEDGRRNSKTCTYAIIKKGTKVSCIESKRLSDGSTWVRIPSGWICAKGKFKIYVK